MRNRHSLIRSDTVEFPKLIAFFGPDGTGKSTQATLMTKHMQSKGFRTKKVWIRSVHTFAFLLWKIFLRLNLCNKRNSGTTERQSGLSVQYLNETSHRRVRAPIMTTPILRGDVSRLIWSTIEVVSVLPIILSRVYFPLTFGYVIIAERYVVDSIVSIAYSLDDEHFVKNWLAKLLIKFIPKQAMLVFLDADYQTILSRRGEFTEPRQYIEFHKRLYTELAYNIGAIHIDTSRLSIKEAHRKIVKSLPSQLEVRS